MTTYYIAPTTHPKHPAAILLAMVAVQRRGRHYPNSTARRRMAMPASVKIEANHIVVERSVNGVCLNSVVLTYCQIHIGVNLLPEIAHPHRSIVSTAPIFLLWAHVVPPSSIQPPLHGRMLLPSPVWSFNVFLT